MTLEEIEKPRAIIKALITPKLLEFKKIFMNFLQSLVGSISYFMTLEEI